MKRRARTIISTKIEANKDKIYRTGDIHDLACLVFPNRNACELKAAFILIFLAIKYHREQKVTAAEIESIRLDKAPELSMKSLWKARAVMARIGLIGKRFGYWQFSSVFSKSMMNLAGKINGFMSYCSSREIKTKDWFLLDCALSLKTPVNELPGKVSDGKPFL